MNRDGSSPRPLFAESDAEAYDPSWSPDGQELLFTSHRTGDPPLYRIWLDGSGLRPIAALDNLKGRSDWSPDGRSVAASTGLTWQHEIIWLPLPNADPLTLTHGGNNLSPGFSPDGQWLVYTSYRDLPGDENGCEIYIMRLDGSQNQRLTENDYCDWQPNWGP